LTTPLRIAVIGGGIGGLAAAVSLLRAKFEVDVYEQALELNEVGGGINMAPNAVRVLHRLGFAEGLDREGVRPRFTHQRRWQDGRTLQRAPLNPLCEELYGAPHMTIHRADLLAVIASGFPAERIHLGHRLIGLADRGDVVEAWFDNGARITADVLVGADAIHSAVRHSSAKKIRPFPAASRIVDWCRSRRRGAALSRARHGPRGVASSGSHKPGRNATSSTGRERAACLAQAALGSIAARETSSTCSTALAGSCGG
jgi:2-polyprenyl-6-methoxyphenol hydroxylase-like FAD-dependent oxidoreductase